MRLLIQPGAGVAPLVKAVTAAKKSVDIAIFRFDQRELERALAKAVSRGVSVNALIAHTNRAGEDGLRKLELRLLAAGVTVARTADDLVRYHGKWMIVDGRELYLLAFNLTYMDIDRSRSFGISTVSREDVREALRLFEADMKRVPYEPGDSRLVVSPANARNRLAAFIQGAKKRLDLYDPKVSDRAMIRLLEERVRAGVKVRIIGRLTRRVAGIEVQKLRDRRLHTRTMLRDGVSAFIGSQSLRQLELDGRRELGIIFRDAKLVARLTETFEKDWDHGAAQTTDQAGEIRAEPATIAKRVAKAIAKEIPPVAPLVDGAVKELVGEDIEIELVPAEVEAIVKDAVKDAVKEVVRDVVEEVVERSSEAAGK